MNPFSLKYNPQYFCNRMAEVELLRQNSVNGKNTLIHSPRRLGKSSLIRHFFNIMEEEKKFETLYVDLFATSNLGDLTRELGETVLKKYYIKNLLSGIKKLFSGLTASINVSSDGMPQLNLSLEESQVNSGLEEIFTFLNKRKKPVIIAFDEFQELAQYPEKAEAVLRKFAQKLNNVIFIFSGSSNHILQNMFFGPKQPFFQSSESLFLKKIERDDYSSFIDFCFKSQKKNIDSEAVEYLLDFSEVHTFYTQSVCNLAFYKTEKNLTKENAKIIADNYLETHKLDYSAVLNLLPENQQKVIKAIAKEGIVEKPTSIEFLLKHRLPSSSSTLQAVKVLDEKEIIYKNEEGYKVYDVFFRRFLEKYF